MRTYKSIMRTYESIMRTYKSIMRCQHTSSVHSLDWHPSMRYLPTNHPQKKKQSSGHSVWRRHHTPRQLWAEMRPKNKTRPATRAKGTCGKCKTDLLQEPKRPAQNEGKSRIGPEPHARARERETEIIRNDLLQRQKRPSIEAKETYYRDTPESKRARARERERERERERRTC